MTYIYIHTHFVLNVVHNTTYGIQKTKLYHNRAILKVWIYIPLIYIHVCKNYAVKSKYLAKKLCDIVVNALNYATSQKKNMQKYFGR